MHNRGGSQGGFGPALTPMVQRIMIICGVVWIAQMVMRPTLDIYGAVSVPLVLRGWIWQPFTYMWLHDSGGPMHILFNMFALWMFGGTLEQVWGSRRFLNFYLTCGVGAGVIIFLWNLAWGSSVPTLGASGAIFGLLTAFSLIYPDRTIMLLFPPIPIKAIWFIPLLFVLQLAFTRGNVSHIGHLGGVLVAAFLLRDQLKTALNFRSISYRWHRYRMKGRLRAVRREEWERRRNRDDDDQPPTYH